MNKKLLKKYLFTSVFLLLLGWGTGSGTINVFVTFLSLYIAVKFLYEGFTTDKTETYFYIGTIIYIILFSLFGLEIVNKVNISNSEIVNPAIKLLLAGAVSALPFVWYLFKIKSDNNVQNSRCWYFIISPLIIIPLGLLLASI